MSRFSRILRRTLCCLLGVVSGVCAAQQFGNVPNVHTTGGRVTSILTGTFQSQPEGPDVLYVNAPTVTAGISSVVAGTMLNGPPGLTSLAENTVTFINVTNVIAASADFDNDGKADFAFALSPTVAGTTNFCVYYGTGYAIGSGSSYDGGKNGQQNSYLPVGGKNGCMILPITGTLLPNFTYIAASRITSFGLPYLIVEDSANGFLYVIANAGGTGFNGALNGFSIAARYSLPADGAGPIYFGNFNGDGFTDFIINSQTGHSASIYIGNGDGTFQSPVRYTFNNGVYSMLLQDMNGARANGIPIQDMVVEGNKGVIEIHPGDGNGGFLTNTIGSFPPGLDGFFGNGGHLAAIDPNTLNILTSTPIGLSVLQDLGSLNYTLKGIYNIGSGHSSFALADFRSVGTLDLAVDSAEGVAIAQGDGNGGFKTNLAYSALAPALGATAGQFRTTNNPTNSVDVVVATGATQAQLLTGNGDGTFNTFPVVVDTSGPTTQPFNPPPPGVWSNILSGDFDGDGKLDVLYSLTGLPQPPPSGSPLALYIQYGNGDGTFNQTGNPIGASGTAGNPDGLYLESAVGDFNGDGISDVATSNAFFDGTGLGNINRAGFLAGFLNPDSNNTDFNQVAAGFFKTVVAGRIGQQDLVFQQGISLIPYKNKQNNSGNFTAQPTLTVPLSPTNYAISTVLLTDIDGDGYGDILALYHNLASDPSNPVSTAQNWLYIWWGKGDGTFSAPFTMQLSRNYYLAAVADMNGDKLPDIALSDGYIVSILYNQTGRSFVSDFGTCTVSPCGETHFLAGQGINSLTLESVRGGKTPDLVVANGGATISNPIVLGGASQTSANLPVNPDVITGGITVLLNSITALPTSGTLAALTEPSNIGQGFIITATLIPTAGVAAPTGTVTFYLDGTAVTGCSLATVAPGTTTSTAQCSVPAGNSYLGGVHPMTAVYGGDKYNAQAVLTGPNGTHLIDANTTTTNLYLCVGPTAQCPSTGVINPAPPYIANLSMIYGQTFNGITNVSAANQSTLLGNVVLNDVYNGVQLPTLCTLPALSNSSCPPNVGTGTQVGVNVFTSSYVPLPLDTTNGPSNSAPVTITVTPDTPTATVTSSLNPAPSGQAVTLTATLLGANAPLGTTASPVGLYVPPTGTVVFMNGSTVLCSPSVALAPSSTGVSSTATCTTSTLPVGTNTITASYASGQDINFNGTTSAPFTETITKVNTTDFTLSATPNPVNAGVGYAALLTVTVAVYNGFAEGVNLSCGNLPNEATCTFAPPAIPSGGGPTTLIVETTAPHTCGTTQPYFLGGNGGGPHLAPFALPALAGLVAFLIPGKRRWLRSLMALIAVAAITQISGCSTCTDLGTKPATYTFQVIGTSAVTGEVQSQTVTLNITI